jgi:tetratricopeptide (TPR) repeat protein
MPLALLLAASWVDVLGPGEISVRIADGISGETAAGLDFLAADLRDLPARQRSMRAVFDTTWKLLTARERAVMEAISVFRGGFTAEAAQEVVGAGPRVLQALARKSLLQRDAPSREKRYRVHELLRQYAEGKLTQAPARDREARDRHAAYYARTLEDQARTGAWLSPQDRTVELDNGLAGWRWTVEGGRTSRLRALVYGLGQTYFESGRFSEGTGFCQDALAALECFEPSEDRDVARAIAMMVDARFSISSGKSAQVADYLLESQAILRQRGAWEELAECNLVCGWASLYPDARQAELVEESLAMAIQADRPTLQREAHLMLCSLAVRNGRYEEAQRHAAAALEICKDTDRLSDQMWSWGFLGDAALVSCDYMQARQWYLKALDLCERMRNWSIACGQLSNLGDVALGLGEYEQARKRYEEAISLADGRRAFRDVARSLGGLGMVALAAGDVAGAQRYCQRALGYAAEATDGRSCAEVLIRCSALLAQGGRATLAVELLALVLAYGATPDTAPGRARQRLELLRAELSPAAFAAAQERGRARDLWATVAELLAEWEGEE